MQNLPVFHTSRLLLKILDKGGAPQVADYYARNRAFHQPWFAERPDQVFTVHQQEQNLVRELADFEEGRAVPFWLFRKDDPNRVIGRFAFTSIVHGCFDSCCVAYHVDQVCQGQGIALEAGEAAIPLLFRDFRLHRIEANIMPANIRSIALAERLGFRLEGVSPLYLKINGRWEDHLHYVRLASEDIMGMAASRPLSEAADGLARQANLATDSLILRTLQVEDLPACVDYAERNRDFLTRWNPAMTDDSTNLAGWQRLAAGSIRDLAAGRRLFLGLFLKDQPTRLVGTIDFRSIMPLPYSSCEIGYSIDRLLSGRGLMLEALSTAISYAFARFGLRRINAACSSGNERSRKLLSILGFVREGLARQAVQIGGEWQDVVNLALLKDEFRTAAG
jgi:[ribosomal protein S5]-alanine N-acetyltransferase